MSRAITSHLEWLSASPGREIGTLKALCSQSPSVELPPTDASLSSPHSQFLCRAPPLALGWRGCCKGLVDDECEKDDGAAPGLGGAV